MKITDQVFEETLARPLQKKGSHWYAIEEEESTSYDESSEKGVNRLKHFLKQWPWFYEFIWTFFSPGISLNRRFNSRGAVRHFYSVDDLKRKLVISIGAGIKRIDEEVIHVDIYPLAAVDIVADARDLPFKDGTVAMVVCESVLEHVADYKKVIKEIDRVLAPGGHVYLSVPFVYPFHASPNDFHRWSIPGLIQELPGYEIEKKGMRAGPAAALQAMLMHFFALPFSLGFYSLYHAWSIFFMFLFSPLKILDLIWGEIPNASDIAADIYIMTTKK